MPEAVLLDRAYWLRRVLSRRFGPAIVSNNTGLDCSMSANVHSVYLRENLTRLIKAVQLDLTLVVISSISTALIGIRSHDFGGERNQEIT